MRVEKNKNVVRTPEMVTKPYTTLQLDTLVAQLFVDLTSTCIPEYSEFGKSEKILDILYLILEHKLYDLTGDEVVVLSYVI
jgi:hypothetical protein